MKNLFKFLLVALILINKSIFANVDTVSMKVVLDKVCNEEINQDKYVNYSYKHLKGKLMNYCIELTGDEKECNLLEDSFTYLDGVASMSIQFVKPSKKEIKANRKSLIRGTGRYNYEKDLTDDEVIKQVKEDVTKKAMHACIQKSKSAKLCLVQENSFYYENSSYKERSPQNQYYMGANDYYYATIYVKQIKE